MPNVLKEENKYKKNVSLTFGVGSKEEKEEQNKQKKTKISTPWKSVRER